MDDTLSIEKGLSLKVAGVADRVFGEVKEADLYAVKPDDFWGVTPKLAIKEGDPVACGTPLFYDKNQQDIKFCSPVSGKVEQILRGERRKLLAVIVRKDNEEVKKVFTVPKDLEKATREELVNLLLESGLWPFIYRRPYNILASPQEVPRDIFISAYNTAPLDPDVDFLLVNEAESFQKGIDVLRKLTSGSVNLGMDKSSGSHVLNGVSGANVYRVSGKHPAGTVGVQIEKIAPINKGEVVWTLRPMEVVFIGRLFMKRHLNLHRPIVLCGSEVKAPRYYRIMAGSQVSSLVGGTLKEGGNKRIISGNVLTGKKIEAEGFLGVRDEGITVIPEGDEYEMFGWLAPGLKKLSASKTFLSSLLPNKKPFSPSANLHGGERAFVLSDQYDKVVPMDIFPVFLLKAILAGDIDKMEQLGIYEVVEEDLALCDFVCASKIEAQAILRQGIELMIKECGI